MIGKTDMITLDDGRVLGFAQYGDLNGKPLFYFHGWPASRLSAEVYHQLGKKLHIRIIAPDRPGYGISDFQNDRTLLDWPDDVLAIADFLHITKFAVMGVSGGGPFAAVCAYKIPKRITRTGIVVGLSPMYGKEALDGMMWMSKIGWENFGKYSWLRVVSSLGQFFLARYSPSLGLYRYLFPSDTDRKLHSSKELRLRTKETMKEAFRQGWYGPAHDLMLYSTDWGYKLSDIHIPVSLWYGANDKNVSLNMGKHYKEKILNSKLIVYPREGHLISLTHAEDILRMLFVG